MGYKKITPMSYVPGEGLGGSKEHFQAVKKKLRLPGNFLMQWHPDVRRA